MAAHSQPNSETCEHGYIAESCDRCHELKNAARFAVASGTLRASQRVKCASTTIPHRSSSRSGM
jgi:hypothetical protein